MSDGDGGTSTADSQGSQQLLGGSPMPKPTPVSLLDGIEGTSVGDAPASQLSLAACKNDCIQVPRNINGAGIARLILGITSNSIQGSQRLLDDSPMPQRTAVPVLDGIEGMSVGDAPASQGTPETPVHGVKGPSVIMTIPRFNPVDAFISDYQHCVCLGVMRQLVKQWLDTENHSQPWYAGTKLVAMNDILLGILPPTEVTRTPRKFE
ncbi:unnamed protein product, partial [Ixodes hexagonus]